MISIRGKVWFILLALIRKRIGSLLKVTKSRRIRAASQRWKKNNKFLISEKFLDKPINNHLWRQEKDPLELVDIPEK